jgi:hypothetical protein
MKEETQQNIDSFVPEGWEFQEAYLEKALAELNRQQRWMKWKKIGLWSAAAAVVITIGATFLHVCSSPVVLEAKQNTSPVIEESIAPKNSASNTKSNNNSLSNVSAQTIPTESGSHSANSVAQEHNPKVENTYKTSNQPNVNSAQGVDHFKRKRSAAPNTIEPTNQSATASTGGTSDTTPSHQDSSSQTTGASTNTMTPPSGSDSKTESPTTSSTAQASEGTPISSPTLQIDMETSSALPYDRAEFIASHSGGLNMPESPMLNPLRIGTNSRHRWSAFVGNAMWADYGKTSNALQWQPVVGIAHHYRLRGPWSLQSQLSYSSIQDPGAIYKRLQVVYDYEQLQSTTSVATNRLQYFNLHTGIHYRFSDQWSASLGIGAGIKITGQNTITRTDVNAVTTSDEASGYVAGFQRLNMGINPGIAYQLTPRFGLGIQGIVGLTDVSNDAVFNEQKHQSNSQLNLILSYRFQ